MVGDQDERGHGRVAGQGGQAGQAGAPGPRDRGRRPARPSGSAPGRPSGPGRAGPADAPLRELAAAAPKAAPPNPASASSGAPGHGRRRSTRATRSRGRVAPGQHHVEGRLGRPQRTADRGAHHGDPRAQLPHVDPAQRLPQDLGPSPGSARGPPPTTRSSVVLPTRWVRAAPTAPRSHGPGDVVEQGRTRRGRPPPRRGGPPARRSPVAPDRTSARGSTVFA